MLQIRLSTTTRRPPRSAVAAAGATFANYCLFGNLRLSSCRWLYAETYGMARKERRAALPTVRVQSPRPSTPGSSFGTFCGARHRSPSWGRQLRPAGHGPSSPEAVKRLRGWAYPVPLTPAWQLFPSGPMLPARLRLWSLRPLLRLPRMLLGEELAQRSSFSWALAGLCCSPSKTRGGPCPHQAAECARELDFWVPGRRRGCHKSPFAAQGTLAADAGATESARLHAGEKVSVGAHWRWNLAGRQIHAGDLLEAQRGLQRGRVFAGDFSTSMTPRPVYADSQSPARSHSGLPRTARCEQKIGSPPEQGQPRPTQWPG